MTDDRDSFSARLTALDEEALLRIVDSPEDYTQAALEAARTEIDRRGGIERVEALAQTDGADEPAVETKPLLVLRAFSRSGRFTRGEYAAVALPALGLNLAAFFVPGLLLLRGGYGSEHAERNWLLAGLLFFLPCALVSAAIIAGAAAQRLRDMGRRGWWALLLIVPYVKLAVLLGLVIIPGRPPRGTASR